MTPFEEAMNNLSYGPGKPQTAVATKDNVVSLTEGEVARLFRNATPIAPGADPRTVAQILLDTMGEAWCEQLRESFVDLTWK